MSSGCALPPSYYEAQQCEVLVARRKVQAVSPAPQVEIREASVSGGGDHFSLSERRNANPLPRANPDAKYESMDSMGFPRELSERALAQADGDPQRAIEMILNGQIQEQAPKVASKYDSMDLMGFPRELSERALAQADGDPQRAIEMILNGQIQEQAPKATPSLSSEREISEAMKRISSRPPNDNLAASIFMELPKQKKTLDGWIPARIQEAMTLYNVQSSQAAAELCRDVWTDKLTLEKLARDSSLQASLFQEEEPLVRRQSAKAECAVCSDDLSVSMMYVRMCERQEPSSAHGGAVAGGGSAAGVAEACRVCYLCLFDGLFSQFKDGQLPKCIACFTPMHQSAFNECMTILEANFSTSLGHNHLNNRVCTCGSLAEGLWQGSAAQNPESIKQHTKECSFAIIKRMKSQADEIIMQSALAGNEFMVACPGAGCKSHVEVAVVQSPATGKLLKLRECVRCSSCRTSFCPKCGTTPYHFNTQCEEIAILRGEYTDWMTRGRQEFLRQRAEMDASFRKQLQEYEADKARVEAEKVHLQVVAQQAAADEAYKAQHCKMCPGCGRIVEHTGGCDSMVCGQDYHGGNRQQGCGQSFKYSQAPAYRAQDVQPRQVQFNRAQPQQIVHRWQLCEGQDLPCDACAGPVAGPKFTCVNCESLTICATCESLGPQALQGRLNKAHFGAHQTNHTFMLEMPPDM